MSPQTEPVILEGLGAGSSPRHPQGQRKERERERREEVQQEEEEEEKENATAGGGRGIIVGNGCDFIRTRSPGRLGSAVMRGVPQTRGGTSEGLIGRRRHYYWA